MRNAVREYVSTINAKVNVKQNVIVISICSLWVSIFISWMDGSSTYALFDAGTKSLLCFRSSLLNSDSGNSAYPPRWAICPDTLYCPALPSDRAGLLLSIPRNSAPFPSYGTTSLCVYGCIVRISNLACFLFFNASKLFCSSYLSTLRWFSNTSLLSSLRAL